MHLFEAASTADARRAAEMLVRAGHRALDRLAYEDAAERFDRALEALELAGAEDESGPVLLARGDALPARRRARRGPRGVHRGASARASTAPTTRCSRRQRSASPGSASRSSTSTPRRSHGSRRRSSGSRTAALRSRVQARLAVELYYAPDRTRSEALSADAVATARASGDASALASALGARHVALWRPDRVEERLAVADEMIAAAREAGDRHAELQAHNWRVTDLFELGDMPAWREEAARHARLAEELRLPAFQWYTPLWAAVEAMLAGRYDDAERLRRRGGGGRACAPAIATPSCSRAWCASAPSSSARRSTRSTSSSSRTRSPTRPPASPTAAAYAWILAGLGETERARERARRGDGAHRTPSTRTGCHSRPSAPRRACCSDDATHAATLYERLAPYAGRPVTAGRAVCSYGAVDRSLGGLAALLGRKRRRDAPPRGRHPAQRRARLRRLARPRRTGPRADLRRWRVHWVTGQHRTVTIHGRIACVRGPAGLRRGMSIELDPRGAECPDQTPERSSLARQSLR